MRRAASQYVFPQMRSHAGWHAHAAVRVGMYGAGGRNMPRQRRPGHATRIAGAILLALLTAAPAWGADAKKSEYRGWDSLRLANSLVEVQVVPVLGGRVIQFKLGDFEFLWVNPQLAGKPPSPTGLAPDGGWLNYGGDKLWPAPQGWGGGNQWPGPPDAVLDGGPYAGRIVVEKAYDMHTVRLDSPEDKRSGVQFTRWIRVYSGSRAAANVTFDTRMTNIDTKPRRWGIWQVTQVGAVNRSGGAGYNKEVRCWSPVNPASIYPRGYNVLYGAADNPSFSVDPATKMFSANYQRIVGKVGLDNSAGWVAVTDGAAGYVFVERFEHFPDKKYPDQASAEFWLNGAGKIVTGDKTVDIKDDPVETPPYVESEILSPFAELKPGESYTFHLGWFAARIGGNYPILDCTAFGVTCEPFTAKAADGRLRLAGRFGVFYIAHAALVALDADGKDLETIDLKLSVSPLEPLVLAKDEPLPAKAAAVRLVLLDSAGKEIGELARTQIAK